MRSLAVHLAAALVLGLLASATLASTEGAGPPTAAPPEGSLPEGSLIEEPVEEQGEPAAPTVEAEPRAEEAHEGEGFGRIRSEQARAFGECMRERGGGGEGNRACADHRPGPAHATAGHPGRGPEAKPDHAGKGKPDHAGKGKPDHAGGRARG